VDFRFRRTRGVYSIPLGHHSELVASPWSWGLYTKGMVPCLEQTSRPAPTGNQRITLFNRITSFTMASAIQSQQPCLQSIVAALTEAPDFPLQTSSQDASTARPFLSQMGTQLYRPNTICLTAVLMGPQTTKLPSHAFWATRLTKAGSFNGTSADFLVKFNQPCSVKCAFSSASIP
jgi:hypothetical protein